MLNDVWCGARFLDGRVWPLEDELEVRLMIDLIRHVTGQSHFSGQTACWLASIFVRVCIPDSLHCGLVAALLLCQKQCNTLTHCHQIFTSVCVCVCVHTLTAYKDVCLGF